MKQYICDLKEGDKVEGLFLVKERRLMEYRSKPGRYLHLVVADRSGEMEARMWEAGESFLPVCRSGKVLFLTGEVILFRGTLQIKVTGMQVPPAGEVDPSDFVAVSKRPLQQMSEELVQMVESISPGPLREIARSFLSSEWYSLFCRAPAAQSYHHNYIGGLIEHTLGVVRTALKIAEVYGGMDRDLLLLGAMLHDVGKVEEMELTPGIEYTDQGKLLGHIVLGIQITAELINRVGAVDADLRNRILHIIASHHGEYEWQSPKRPHFVEAKVIHLADLMDAEIFKFSSALPAESGSRWSQYIKSLGNQVYLGGKPGNGGEGCGQE